MSDTLKPCPFCKREPQQMMRIDSLQSGDENYLAARCEHHTHWMPVEQWNRRSLDAGAVREAIIEEVNRLVPPSQMGLRARLKQAILELGQINAAPLTPTVADKGSVQYGNAHEQSTINESFRERRRK